MRGSVKKPVDNLVEEGGTEYAASPTDGVDIEDHGVPSTWSDCHPYRRIIGLDEHLDCMSIPQAAISCSSDCFDDFKCNKR